MSSPLRPPLSAQTVRRRRGLLAAGALLLVGVLWWTFSVALAPVGSSHSGAPSTAPTITAPPSVLPQPTPTPTPTTQEFDKAALSIDDPMSIWIVADKLRPLNPVNFVPSDLVTAQVRYSANATLRAEAATAMERMFAVAAAEGAGVMMLQNAFRSYETQVRVYANNVARLGQTQADIASARPGHSEHQTGLSADIMPDDGHCGVEECFAQTPQGIWLAENAWRFGYHLRYPPGKTPITGFAFEPWHYRYIGVNLSTEMHQQGIVTLEEFFGLPAAPSYAG